MTLDLTSLAVKSFEGLVRANLLKQVQDSLDVLKFADRGGRDVEDDYITLLHLQMRYLEGSGTHARFLLLICFNTIQPNILAHKLFIDFNIYFNLVY